MHDAVDALVRSAQLLQDAGSEEDHMNACRAVFLALAAVRAQPARPCCHTRISAVRCARADLVRDMKARLWRLAHNFVAHPLMELLPARWGTWFHDETARRAFGAHAKDR